MLGLSIFLTSFTKGTEPPHKDTIQNSLFPKNYCYQYNKGSYKSRRIPTVVSSHSGFLEPPKRKVPLYDRISEIQVMFCKNQYDSRINGFIRLVFDDSYLLGDLRLIETNTDGKNRVFLAMPSRYAELRCPHCNHRTPKRGRFCFVCGVALPEIGPLPRDHFHIDAFHPLTHRARQRLEGFVLDRVLGFKSKASWVYQRWYILIP